MRSQEARKSTAIGRLLDIALPTILRDSGSAPEKCKWLSRALATGTLVLGAAISPQVWGLNRPGKASKSRNFLSFLRALHNLPNGVLRRFAFMEYTGHLLGDRQVDLCFTGQRKQRRGGAHPFRNHAHAGENFGKRAALAQLDAHLAIAAKRAGARKHQIAQAGQAR